MAKRKVSRATTKRRQTRRQQKAMFAKLGSTHKGRGRIEIDSTGFPVRVFERNRQIGKTTPKVDKKIKALHPGKRVSNFGNVYYEYRRNRSDRDRKKNF